MVFAFSDDRLWFEIVTGRCAADDQSEYPMAFQDINIFILENNLGVSYVILFCYNVTLCVQLEPRGVDVDLFFLRRFRRRRTTSGLYRCSLAISKVAKGQFHTLPLQEVHLELCVLLKNRFTVDKMQARRCVGNFQRDEKG